MCAQSVTISFRPLGSSLQAYKPKEEIHFDYCWIWKGAGDARYLLILMDDFSRFVGQNAFTEPNSANTEEALIKWFSAFGTARTRGFRPRITFQEPIGEETFYHSQNIPPLHLTLHALE